MNIFACIKKSVLRPLKWIYVNQKLRIRFLKFDTNKTNKFLLLMTPQYGNLGDHCIAFSEIEFLKNNYPNIIVDEIPFD